MIKAKPDRISPTWAEIVVSFACTTLIATDVQFGRNSNLPQSAESYYFAYQQVQIFHALDVFFNIVFLLLTLSWIVLPVTAKFVKPSLIVAALIGFILCWAEIVWAASLHTAPVFHLKDLPFRPVGNNGVIGAQVFATYLLLRAPSGKMSPWQASFLKLGLAVCFWFFQLLVWDGIRRLTG